MRWKTQYLANVKRKMGFNQVNRDREDIILKSLISTCLVSQNNFFYINVIFFQINTLKGCKTEHVCGK